MSGNGNPLREIRSRTIHMTRLRYQTGGLTHSSNIMMEKPAVMRPRYSPWLVSSGRHPRPRSSIRRSARAATMHMLHVISRPESQKTAMMVMTTILSISSSLRGDCRFLCRVISTRAPSDTITGVIVRVCGRVGTAFLSGSRTSLVGKHADYGKYGMQRREKNEKRPEQVRKTLIWGPIVLFRPPVCLEGGNWVSACRGVRSRPCGGASCRAWSSRCR